MLKIAKNRKIEDLKSYGFTSFKVNRNQTNYYRIFAHSHQGKEDMILVNDIAKEIMIVSYEGKEDTRVHAYPRIRMKDKSFIEDVIYDLAKDGVIERG